MADNYGPIKRFGMLIYRKLRYTIQFSGKEISEGSEGNDVITKFILSGEPGMIGRIGAVEGRFIYARLKGKSPSNKNLHNLNECAGVFPMTSEEQNIFYDEYSHALEQSDFFVAWSVKGARKIYDTFCPQAELIGFFALEPFFFDNPWTAALAGKRVLVVHPFTETIKNQYKKRRTLFENPDTIPEFRSFCTVKAVQSNAGNNAQIQFSSWKEALDHMKAEIAEKDFDIAIIGAGAYGIPLAAYVKELGKQAIHVAGVTQMLFGIRGKRWDADPKYQRFFNENWVYPSECETPQNIMLVEGGSYWK